MSRNERIAVREAYFETITGKELFEFMCGDLIGYGIHRVVFEFKPDPTCVIKFENNPGRFANVREWEMWRDLQMTPMKKWLAPCISISENGIWMVQKRTKPIPEKYKLPGKVPRWMTDIKAQNFGLYKGQLVCHDYANHLCVNHAISTAMKKAEWF
jgi:hypothetical protein